jgi:UDP-N-acetylmuramoyl-tripeptide--D-alanyl-D-alanine ligase
MRLFKFITYQLYLLQLDNYEVRRYLAVALRKSRLRRSSVARKPLVWTSKLKVVFTASLLLELAVLVIGLMLLYPYFPARPLFALLTAVVLLFILIFGYSLFLGAAVILTRPLDYFLKQRVLRAASRKLQALPKLKIIAVAGSYGKTTMKGVAGAVLAQRYNVLMTPDSINTPVGLARLILNRVDNSTDFLVAEMGEYYPGDIRELTEFLKPNLGIITGITEAHLERFGSKEAITKTIFELAVYSPPEMPLVLNADDQNIAANYKEYAGEHPLSWYSADNNPLSLYRIGDFRFDADRPGISFTLDREGKIISFDTSFLGRYILGTITAALIVGSRFGIEEEQAAIAAKNLLPVPHRLQPIQGEGGVLIIDDSYNGNPAGVEEAIKVLANFPGRRKIYLTPGLVEAGDQAQVIHEQIGHSLATTADMVLLIRNSVTPYIYNGLVKAGFPPAQVKWFESAAQAHGALPDLLKKGDVVLFQNDWPDNYL